VVLEPLVLPALPEPQAPAEEPAAAEPGTFGTACGETGSLGTPISLDFKDGDLQDIFRLFADISGLNVVVNPGVSGKVTLKLNEVPWARALELILKTNGLGCVLEDNVIRIAKLTDLQREETERRKLEEEKQLAGNLVDFTKRISYAKAMTLSDVLKKAGALSPRGQLNVDERTNTIIIRDLEGYIRKAEGLIAELDTATPQVEIEARIVVTTRNFTRDLGIQWGFSSEQSVRYGNTTDRVFPNSIILNGSGVTSDLGLPADNTGPGGSSSSAGIGAPGRGYMVNLPASGFNSGIGISMGNILGSFNLDVALTALERQGRGRLLSTPKVTTQNNQAAEIKQGLQIPIQTVANNTVTVQFKDAVLTLKVTPQITDAGTVILNLEVENNAADFANLVNGIPPINTQSAKTIVLVRDGHTAVVGGIYQSTEVTSQQSTPFLSKIPVLGYLFKNNFMDSRNNELLLFITPRIVKS
jgi:type IV pilus assembly protein PilQ